MQPINALIAVALVVMISGCAGNDVILKKQRETDLRVSQLVEGYSDINEKVAALTRELNDLQDQVKSNATSYEEIKPSIDKMKDELDRIAPAKTAPAVSTPAPRIEVEDKETIPAIRDKEVTAKTSPAVSTPTPRIEVVSKETVPAKRDDTIQDEYMKAYGIFSENNYSGAIEAFTSFIKKYPESEYAGNAQYWIGECHYTQQDFPKALTAFNRVLISYPKGKKVPDAMLKIGFSHISMNDQAKAKAALQNLVNKYPNSQAAIKARERLSHF
jgi:tol-pal system protein YbgF